jgi:prepilin signal peptidase PulO-like enzyme (type II secretory pathway)
VTILLVSLLAIGGWLVGGAIWIIAGAIAGTRPLVFQSVCPACAATIPPPSSGPAGALTALLGYRQFRSCPHCGSGRWRAQPLFQLGTAVYCAAAGLMIDNDLRLIAALVFLVPLSAVALLDLWIRQVFSNLIVLGIFLGVLFAAFDGLSPFKESIQGAIAGGIIVAVFYFLAGMLYETRKRGPVGLVDILLGAMIGAMVRWPLVVTALFVGSLLAALLGVSILFIFRANRRPRVRYGPFLCLGALLVLLVRF